MIDRKKVDLNWISGIGSLNLSEVKVEGVKELYQNHANEDTKGIKVHFRLDDSGVLRLDKVFTNLLNLFKLYWKFFIRLMLRLKKNLQNLNPKNPPSLVSKSKKDFF